LIPCDVGMVLLQYLAVCGLDGVDASCAMDAECFVVGCGGHRMVWIG
jgi:hypothetical protein